MLENLELGDDDMVTDEQSEFCLDVDHYSKAVGYDIARTTTLRQPDCADAFHALFADEVKSAARPANKEAAAWWKQFFDTPRARRLRGTCVGKTLVAQAAAEKLARELKKLGDDGDDSAPDANRDFEAMASRQKAVAKAIDDAQDEADEVDALVAGIGMGLDAKVDSKSFRQHFERIRKSHMLRKVLQLAGGMIEFRNGRRKEKLHGYDLVSGVTQCGDLSRLLPSEVAMLADDTLEDDLLRRLVEDQTLVLEKYSEVAVGKGPMVVIVDESGSMSGEPIAEAKAFALVMAKIAQRERRWVCFVSFSDSFEQKFEVFEPDCWDRDMDRLLKWLDHFYQGGGTCFSVLNRVAEKWDELGCPKGKTDIYFITDTGARLTDDIVHPFNEFKEREKVSCYGLAIGSPVGDLLKVCDQAWETDSMGLESEVIQEIVSK